MTTVAGLQLTRGPSDRRLVSALPRLRHAVRDAVSQTDCLMAPPLAGIDDVDGRTAVVNVLADEAI
jgi:hypothetical protein